MIRNSVVFVTAQDMADAVELIENGQDVEWFDSEGYPVTLTTNPEFDCA